MRCPRTARTVGGVARHSEPVKERKVTSASSLSGIPNATRTRLAFGFGILALLCASLLLGPRPVSALTGMELLRRCEGRAPQGMESLGEILCVTYLSGLVDGYLVGTIPLDMSRRPLCPPAQGIQNEQMMLIVAKWLRDNPGELNNDARVSAVLALAKAFPCRR